MATFQKDPDARLEWSFRWGAPLWVTGTDYFINESVVKDPATGFFYQCIEDHTAGATLTADKKRWKRIKGTYWLLRDRLLSASAWAQSSKDPSTATDAVMVIDTDDTYSTTVWIEGGDVGATYEFTNSVEDDATPNTRKDDRTFKLKIKQE